MAEISKSLEGKKRQQSNFGLMGNIYIGKTYVTKFDAYKSAVIIFLTSYRNPHSC